MQNLECSDCEKLLGVKIDSELSFDCHVSNICKKVHRKINAVARRAPYMNIGKQCILMNWFFKSQFNYCSKILMCHSHSSNTKIK